MNGVRYGALLLAMTGGAVIAACGVGDVGAPSGGAAMGPTPMSTSSNPMDASTDSDCIACSDNALPENQHVLRLTNSQWEQTTQALLRLDAAPGNSVNFNPEPESTIGTTFGIDAKDIYIDGDRWAQYRDAAVANAQLVVGDDTKLAKILPAAAQDTSQTDDVRYAAFVNDFLPRAYRRPVTPAEVASMTMTSQTFASSAVSGDGFHNRVLATIQSALQSPYYLYRIFGGVDTVTKGRARLTAYEIASKLSYSLWNTMPDDSVIAHASAGDLATSDGVANVAKAMLTDPRASANLVAFHDELYATSLYAKTLTPNSRSTTDFPDFSADFVNDAVQDIRLSIADIIFTQHGGFKELQSSPTAFVNTRLAPVYGIDPSTIPDLAGASTDKFVKIQMDASRRGILMHPGWLAYEGTGNEPSTIHRGVYIARHVLCEVLGSPPPAANGKDPSQAKGNTNRDRVTAITACGPSCHGTMINPLGFPFENFDSIGKLRTLDGDIGVPPTFPIDTSGTNSDIGSYANGPDMLAKAVATKRAHACYAAHWVSYFNNATTVDITPSYLSSALTKSLSGGSVEDMLVELVKTDAFLTVSR